MGLFAWIIVALLAIIIVNYLKRIYNFLCYQSIINKIPGPKSQIFFIGLAYELLFVKKEDIATFMRDKSHSFKGGIWRFWLGTTANVQIHKPHQLEVVMRSTTQITKSDMYDLVKPWLGEGLITSSGDKWFQDRRLLTPSFHFNILEQFADVMTEKAQILNERIKLHISTKPDEPLDFFPYALKCALDIICETAMGINVHAQENEGSPYSKALALVSDNLVERLFQPWLMWDFLYRSTKKGKETMQGIKVMHDISYQLIREKREKRAGLKEGTETTNNEEFDDTGLKTRKAFLDLLLDASEQSENPLSDQEIREQVDSFMFAGHDTTATAISWAMFRLGNNLDVQEKVHQELDAVFGDSNAPATTKEIAELKYLERVFKETLRLYPSVPIVSRSLSEDLIIDGHFIPKQTSLLLGIYPCHTDPEVWPDPYKFDPDRFLPENSVDRHPYSYIPFSAGPRNCIGQKFAMLEAKIVLSTILRKYRRVKSLHETVKLYPAMILKPFNGIFLSITEKTI